MELIQERDKVQTGFLDDVILIPSSLAHITEYTDDPLVCSIFYKLADSLNSNMVTFLTTCNLILFF